MYAKVRVPERPLCEAVKVKSRMFFVLYYFIFLFVWDFQDRVSLCSLGSPGTNSVDQTDFELTEIDPPACVSGVLGLKVYSTTTGLLRVFIYLLLFMCLGILPGLVL